jgi:hypothetical protein
MDTKLRDRLLEILNNPEAYPEAYEALMEYVDVLLGYRKDDPMHPDQPRRWPREDDPIHPGPPGPEYFERERGAWT